MAGKSGKKTLAEDAQQDENALVEDAQQDGEKVVKPIIPDLDWQVEGPRLWLALHDLLAGSKTRHDDKYVIEASHEAVGAAHDILAQQAE